MNRHTFTRFVTGLIASMALISGIAQANETLDYTPGLVEERLAAGETLFVDYFATWCSTCARQEKILEELRAENPEFDENITFVKIDWDTYQGHEVTRSRNIPRRSTLLVLRGDEELGRIVAGTDKEAIKALIAKGL